VSSESVPSLESLSMLLSRCSEVRRVTAWTHRVEADIVILLQEKGGTLSRDLLFKYLPYKKQEVNAALKWMIFSGVLRSDRRGEITLVES